MTKPDLRGKFRKAAPAATGSFGPATPAGASPTPPPGLTGQMPLPPGQLITVDNPTASELAALRALKPDFQPGDAAPADFAATLRDVQAMAAYDIANPPLPGAATMPPLVMPEEINLNNLPPQQQAELRRGLETARALQQQREQGIPGAGPGVNEAVLAANIPLADDRGSAHYAAGGAKPAPQAAPTTAQTEAANSGAQLFKQFCPCCNHDLAQPHPPIPTPDERQAFLVALLGGKPYRKRWSLFDGNLIMEARQLTPKEVDMCWHQAYLDDKKNPPNPNMVMDGLRNEYMERVMRYRTALQLTLLQAPGSFTHDLPESTEQWLDSLGTWPLVPGDPDADTIAKPAADYVYETVLSSESILRVVMQQLGDFNRHTVLLEANMGNAGFWEATPEGH